MSKPKSQITLIREAVKMLNGYPGLTKRWPFKVKLRWLDMRDSYDCLLSQLFGTYIIGLCELQIDHLSHKEHGFSFSMSTQLWKTKIRQLRVSYQKRLERKRGQR